MRIAIIGAGYVGLSNAVQLSQRNVVELIDIDKIKIKIIIIINCIDSFFFF